MERRYEDDDIIEGEGAEAVPAFNFEELSREIHGQRLANEHFHTDIVWGKRLDEKLTERFEIIQAFTASGADDPEAIVAFEEKLADLNEYIEQVRPNADYELAELARREFLRTAGYEASEGETPIPLQGNSTLH